VSIARTKTHYFDTRTKTHYFDARTKTHYFDARTKTHYFDAFEGMSGSSSHRRRQISDSNNAWKWREIISREVERHLSRLKMAGNAFLTTIYHKIWREQV
jgi:hypothetical protein